jgi:hypothetical protein
MARRSADAAISEVAEFKITDTSANDSPRLQPLRTIIWFLERLSRFDDSGLSRCIKAHVQHVLTLLMPHGFPMHNAAVAPNRRCLQW